MAMGKNLRVLAKALPESPYSVILEDRTKKDTLLFDSGAVAVLTELQTEAIRKQYSRLADAYSCLGVLKFGKSSTTATEGEVLYLVLVTACSSVGKIRDSEVFRITQTQFVSLRGAVGDDERVSEVRKVLNSGTFYFTWSGSSEPLDLSLCVQRRTRTSVTDNRNRNLFSHLSGYGVDCGEWLVKMMCGAVEIRTIYVGHRQAKACLISRLSFERAGTRFNVRGTNDEGHVANFVETEQVIFLEDEVTSYLQTRGSVPLFWEQPGIQVGSHKVKFSRGTEASKHAFLKHMHLMKERYGRQVIVNLLGASLIGSKEGEATLSQMFQSHHKDSPFARTVPHILFDYHAECKGGMQNLSKLQEKLRDHLRSLSLFYAKGSEIFVQQKGTLRTNCMDCLDRTNCVQTLIGLEILSKQLHWLGLADKPQIVARFQDMYRQMWTNNGNEVSKIYAGTGALQGGNKLMDGARSAARTIQNNLLDSSKQEAIDVLIMGSSMNSELADRARTLLPSHLLQASAGFLNEVVKRYQEFSEHMTLRLAVGTYNINGGKHFRSIVYKDCSLADWLLDCRPKAAEDFEEEPDVPVDIFVVGFEEMVDLNAANIMAASSENAKAWEKELLKTINRDREYVLLTSVQLVGICLFVFVDLHLTPHIRDVATDIVKTGLGGATGNKGAVAVRLVVYNSSMCFVCGHLAPGQSAVTERNQSYHDVSRRLIFPMGKSLNSHDYIIWCGDFNYRVDLTKEEMEQMISESRWEELLEYDQLRVQQSQGNVFNGFLEGPINFPPTYKYDLFSDDYDTSEKCRVPAWTDRVLWRRRKLFPQEASPMDDWSPGECKFYGRAELKQSDHRPVICILDVQVLRVREEDRNRVIDDVIHELGPSDATIVVEPHQHSPTEDDDIEDIFDGDFTQALMNELSAYGQVVLMYFAQNKMWVTFRDGRAALQALCVNEQPINDVVVSVRLKTENYEELVKQELRLGISNTVPLYVKDKDKGDEEEEAKPHDLPLTMPPLSEMQALDLVILSKKKNPPIRRALSAVTAPAPPPTLVLPLHHSMQLPNGFDTKPPLYKSTRAQFYTSIDDSDLGDGEQEGWSSGRSTPEGDKKPPPPNRPPPPSRPPPPTIPSPSLKKKSTPRAGVISVKPPLQPARPAPPAPLTDELVPAAAPPPCPPRQDSISPPEESQPDPFSIPPQLDSMSREETTKNGTYGNGRTAPPVPPRQDSSSPEETPLRPLPPIPPRNDNEDRVSSTKPLPLIPPRGSVRNPASAPPIPCRSGLPPPIPPRGN